MYIRVDPTLYESFFLILVDKFIEIELKGNLAGIPRKLSRKLWLDSWNKDGTQRLAKTLFAPHAQDSFSPEYFWRRYMSAKKYKKPFMINAEAFAKALEYIGVPLPESTIKRQNFAQIAQDLYESFEKSELDKKIKIINGELTDPPDPVDQENNNETNRPIYYKDKAEGTFFLEHGLPESSSKWFPNEKFVNTIIFLDVDNLTVINKNYGREVGDEVLREIAYIIQKTSFDYAGRCGDDTFFIVLFKTDIDMILEVCEDIKRRVNFQSWGAIAYKLRVTSTIGYAISKEKEDIFSCIQRAAIGLLEGKEKGGNTIQAGPSYLSKKDLLKKNPFNENLENNVDSNNFSLRNWFS